jgi:nickel/cobalt transporter (NicO) family protein
VRSRTRNLSWVCLVLCGLIVSSAAAHPLPEGTYDRTIAVQLTPAAVVVDYTLEVDSRTAYLGIPDLLTTAEVRKITDPKEVYQAFLDGWSKPIGNTLYATLDDKPLVFVCKKRTYTLGEHVRCVYRFEAAWKPEPEKHHAFRFYEPNFDKEKGAVLLSLTASPELSVLSVVQPGLELQQRSRLDLGPGDWDRLRSASATFSVPDKEEKKPAEPRPVSPAAEPPESTEQGTPGEPPDHIEEIVLHSGLGFGALLAVVAFLGAAHALTPGHGKTLVAAYLVGERGTLWHALLLGIVTTLTHTGVVLILAYLFPIFFPGTSAASTRTLLEFVGGLLIAGAGFWLFVCRVSGRADHVHLFGGHHHHHGHGHHDHHRPNRPVTLWSLIVLGIAGGIIPCWDAIGIFGLCVKWNRPELAFPLVLAFSAGLAAVLVGVGMAVVSAQRFSAAVLGDSSRLERISRFLPIVSAVLVTALGLWMCYGAVH